jgi:hypothetical protein
MNPQQWRLAGVCSRRDAHVTLLRIYKYHPRTEQGVLQVPRGASFMYKLYSTGARTEPCGTPVVIFLGEESSPSTETLNCLLVEKEAISLIRLAFLTAYIVGQSAMLCQRLFWCTGIQQPWTYDYWNSERRDSLASCIGVSCCDAHGSQTVFRLASLFPQCANKLFLVLISQKFAGSGQEANQTEIFGIFFLFVFARLWQSYYFGFIPRCREVTQSRRVIK